MPSDKTMVTELATGLGMTGAGDPGTAVTTRSPVMSNLAESDWDRLSELWAGGAYRAEFQAGFDNGRAFLASPDGLNWRLPRIVEWTGGRRAPGDEVVPADLRVDHVYLVSCKYLSKILHNPSPARLIDALLTQGRSSVDGTVLDPSDWYLRHAYDEYQALYDVCVGDLPAMPAAVGDLDVITRRRLAETLPDWPVGALPAYAAFCARVAEVTAARWRSSLAARSGGRDAGAEERMLWRLLRIGSAPYFILGADTKGWMRLRIGTPWDWQQEFRFRRLHIDARPGGQPLIGWRGELRVLATGETRVVAGHVELRWSHGRFARPPEAKVYLDTPHREVPGYHPI
jgi:hypothetical protein